MILKQLYEKYIFGHLIEIILTLVIIGIVILISPYIGNYNSLPEIVLTNHSLINESAVKSIDIYLN